MSKTTKKAAPVQPKATSKTNDSNHTGCRCAAQLHFEGFQPMMPQGDAGPLAEWLEAHPGWWGRQFLCMTLGLDERTLRLQSQLSDGRVIFNCTLGGLSATAHSNEVEVLSCVAEMKGRILALATRIRETLRRAGLEGRD